MAVGAVTAVSVKTAGKVTVATVGTTDRVAAAAITEPIRQDTLLSTSGGDVQVTVLQSAAFQLDASTSGGRWMPPA